MYEEGSEESCGGVLNENLPKVRGGSDVGDNVDGLVHCGLCKTGVRRLLELRIKATYYYTLIRKNVELRDQRRSETLIRSKAT